MDSIDRIYSTLRHELGNSVNSLTITLEVLLKNYEYFNEETRIEFISKSLDQVNRQYRILECLRIYQSADIGELSRVELPRFLAEWVSGLREKISKATITLQQQFSGQKAQIRADQEALIESLNNIAENTIEALEGRTDPEIIVSYRLNKGRVEIAIVDNGHGMDPEILNKAEIPLFTTKENRMGLGLSIAKKLILKMDGRLEISSEEAKGTSVKISFQSAA